MLTSPGPHVPLAWQAQIIGGGSMLLFGAFNLLLGSITAIKLKKLRRRLSGPSALLTAFRNRATSEAALDGLNHAAAGRLFNERIRTLTPTLTLTKAPHPNPHSHPHLPQPQPHP